MSPQSRLWARPQSYQLAPPLSHPPARPQSQLRAFREGT